MICRLVVLSNGPLETNFNDILIEVEAFYSRKSIRKCRLENGGPFASALMC